MGTQETQKSGIIEPWVVPERIQKDFPGIVSFGVRLGFFVINDSEAMEPSPDSNEKQFILQPEWRHDPAARALEVNFKTALTTLKTDHFLTDKEQPSENMYHFYGHLREGITQLAANWYHDPDRCTLYEFSLEITDLIASFRADLTGKKHPLLDRLAEYLKPFEKTVQEFLVDAQRMNLSNKYVAGIILANFNDFAIWSPESMIDTAKVRHESTD